MFSQSIACRGGIHLEILHNQHAPGIACSHAPAKLMDFAFAIQADFGQPERQRRSIAMTAAPWGGEPWTLLPGNLASRVTRSFMGCQAAWR